MEIGSEVHELFDRVFVLKCGIVESTIVAANSPAAAWEVVGASTWRIARFLGHHQGGCPFALAAIAYVEISEFFKFLLGNFEFLRVELAGFQLDGVAFGRDVMFYAV